jgi:hypothetical protein
MKTSGNRKLWVIGGVTCLSLFLELVLIAGMFNAPPASSLHRYAFRWNLVCALLAPIALGLGISSREDRLHRSVVLASIVMTGPLLVFISMNPSHPIYCFIQSYKVSPSGTLGGFAFISFPLALSAIFLLTLYQRSRSMRSIGAAQWPH